MCAGSPRLEVLRRLRPIPDRSTVGAPSPTYPPDAGGQGKIRNGSRVHCGSLNGGGARLCPCGVAASTPQTFLAASLTAHAHHQGSSLPAKDTQVRAATSPDPPGSSWRRIKGMSDAGSSRTPLRHACRTQTIWQYWPVPALSGLLPPSPAPPGSGCPQLHRPAATGSAAKVSHLPSNHSASRRTHELRHTAASLAVQAGANVKLIQQMLGHASAAMTLDVYAGLFADNLDEVADRLDQAFARANADQERSNGAPPRAGNRQARTSPRASGHT
jgi:hypothetical protein